MRRKRRAVTTTLSLAALAIGLAVDFLQGIGPATAASGGAGQAATTDESRYIPANTWVKVKPKPTMRFTPVNYTDCTRTAMLTSPVGRRASGIIYGAGVLFYFGGGGSSHPGNDVDVFDIGANTWVDQYQPECLPTCCLAGVCVDGVAQGRICSSDDACPGSQCNLGQCYTGANAGESCTRYFQCASGLCASTTCDGGSLDGAVCGRQDDCPEGACVWCDAACNVSNGIGTVNVTPLGRPYVEHAYQQAAYNPERGKFTLALTSGTWEWDPDTGAWARLTPEVPQSNSVGTTLLLYDPDLRTVLFFATTTFNHTVFRFDYESAEWSAHSSIPEVLAWASLYGGYSPDDHKHLISHHAAPGTLWLYDAPGQSWTQITSAPENLRYASSIAYDSIDRAFLVGTRESPAQWWTYDVAGDLWTKLDTVGGAPLVTTGDRANLLTYDPIWKRFYFANVLAASNDGQGGTTEGDVETWTFRQGGPLGPGDANCDDDLTAADVVGIARASDGAPACGAVDVNRDGEVDADDLTGVVRAIFSPHPSGG